jgi:hypothetical protein
MSDKAHLTPEGGGGLVKIREIKAKMNTGRNHNQE